MDASLAFASNICRQNVQNGRMFQISIIAKYLSSNNDRAFLSVHAIYVSKSVSETGHLFHFQIPVWCLLNVAPDIDVN